MQYAAECRTEGFIQTGRHSMSRQCVPGKKPRRLGSDASFLFFSFFVFRFSVLFFGVLFFLFFFFSFFLFSFFLFFFFLFFFFFFFSFFFFFFLFSFFFFFPPLFSSLVFVFPLRFPSFFYQFSLRLSHYETGIAPETCISAERKNRVGASVFPRNLLVRFCCLQPWYFCTHITWTVFPSVAQRDWQATAESGLAPGLRLYAQLCTDRDRSKELGLGLDGRCQGTQRTAGLTL